VPKATIGIIAHYLNAIVLGTWSPVTGSKGTARAKGADVCSPHPTMLDVEIKLRILRLHIANGRKLPLMARFNYYLALVGQPSEILSVMYQDM